MIEVTLLGTPTMLFPCPLEVFKEEIKPHWFITAMSDIRLSDLPMTSDDEQPIELMLDFLCSDLIVDEIKVLVDEIGNIEVFVGIK